MLVFDTDPALTELVRAWLAADGCEVVVGAGEPSAPAAPADLVVVDVPFPRSGGVDLLRRIAQQHPMTPIVALSSCFFAGVDRCGGVARSLGAQCVCPKPVSRETLVAAVRRLAPR